MTRAELLERIAALAAQVRAAQRAYFRERTTEALRVSKALERDLDGALAKLDAPPPAQGGLFNG